MRPETRERLTEARQAYREAVRVILESLSDVELDEIIGFESVELEEYPRFVEQAGRMDRLDAARIVARRARHAGSSAVVDGGGVWCVYHSRDFSQCPRCLVCGEHLPDDGAEHHCVIP